MRLDVYSLSANDEVMPVQVPGSVAVIYKQRGRLSHAKTQLVVR
jgi:hypothetical protein